MFNNKTKTFLLFTLLFVTILGVSAATAAHIDNNATDTTSISQDTTTQAVNTASDNNIPTKSVSNKEITKNTQKDVKSEGEGTFANLAEDITQSEVKLARDYKKESGETGITIENDKTIDGDGHTINTGNGTLFNISQTSTLTIKNMIITGEGSIASSGYILALNGNLICDNVTFNMENVTSNKAASIRFDTYFANATINNSTFKNYLGTYAAIDTYRYGHLEVDNCNFTNITSKNGAIRISSGNADYMPEYIIKNSQFIDCVDANYGGAIYVNNPNTVLYVDNCLFENCQAGRGAAITAPSKNITVKNSQFRNNKVTGETDDSHGAIITNNDFAVLYTSNNTMDDDEVGSAEIYIMKGKISSPLITGEDVTANPSQEVNITYTLTDDKGNSVFLKGVTYSLKVNEETVTANYDKRVIQGTVTAPSEENDYNVEIIPSITSMYIDPIITNAVLTVGTPTPSLIITDDTYSNFFDADGNIIEGAIPEGSVAKFDGTFTNRNFNISIPMTIDAGVNPAVFDACTFTLASDVTFQNVKFTGTLADSTPMIVSKANTVFENVSFDEVVANYAEIIRAMSDSNITMNNCTVSEFTGGAIVGPSATGQARIGLTITDSRFINNNASFAAIRINSNYWKVNIKNSNFTDNSGNTIQEFSSRHYGNITIDHCNFTNNIGSSKAGVIYIAGNNANLTVTNSYFTGNHVTETATQASQLAGVICVGTAGTRLYLENNVMENNPSPYMNADIYFENYGIMASPIKITTSDVTVTQYEDVNITVNLTDDNGNRLAYNSNGFSYIVSIDDERVFTGNALKTETITADYEPGNYPIQITYDATNVEGGVTVSSASLTVQESPLIKYAAVQALINADTTGTVTLEKEVRRGVDEECIIINKNLILDGNGMSINANGGRVFDITDGATVTIKNMVITNAGNPNVGALNAEGRIANITGGNVLFENVTFNESEAPDFGSAHGSFIIVAPESMIVVNNCTVADTVGTFINLRNATGTINNTVFNDNDATQTSAIIANGGALTVNNTQFTDNKALNSIIYGKAHQMYTFGPSPTTWFTSTSLTVDNTTFTRNKVNNWGVIGVESDTTVINSVFENNTFVASKGGSAIYANGPLTVEHSIFAGNTVGGDSKGSIIYNALDDLSISGSILIPEGTQSSVYNAANEATITANANYWGNNDPTGLYGGFSIDNWVVLNGSFDSDENTLIGDTVTLTVTLNTLNDGTEVTSKLPDYGTINLSSRTGVLGSESLETVDGIASTTFMIDISPYTVTLTYPNQEVIIEGEAKMPEPEVYVLNDGNWTEYFDETTGEVKDWIIPNSELRFEGTFNDRYMVITAPFNLTTAEQQAIFSNCQLVIKGDNVNVTSIQMNGEDIDSLIILNNSISARIEGNQLTLTNAGENQETHSIEVIGGKDNIIKSNIITTTGPEHAVGYTTDINRIYTVSIEAISSQGLIIDGNTIKTMTNGKTSNTGTIYSIYVTGRYYYDEDEEESIITSVEDAQIINNEITTLTDKYGYGILLNYVEDSTVKNNTITTTSEYYGDGIQTLLADNCEFDNNTITIKATSQGYGIISNGMFDMYNVVLIATENNNITNNVISIESDNSWGIELWISDDAIVENNNVTITASNGVAVGIADAYRTNVTHNNLTVTATMDKEADVGDSVSSYTAGIKITETMMGVRGSFRNNVSENNVIVDAPLEVPAVNITNKVRQNRVNNISNNYLISPMGIGDNAVSTNDEVNTVSDNYPAESTITTDKPAYEYKEGTSENIIITVTTITTELGTIEVHLDGSEDVKATIENVAAGETTITTAGLYELINDDSKFNYEVTLVYTNGIMVIPSNTTFTFKVTLNPRVYVLNDGNWTEYFNDDGTLKPYIVPGSELRFEGEFNDRIMEINIPLNLTTADTQAILHNSKFIVNADNVNITRLEMDATDTMDSLITINNSSNTRIEENKLTLTNNGAKQTTHTIEVIGGENNTIKLNTITTTGPEEDIAYTGSTINTIYTNSIFASGSEGIIIDSNNITTRANGNEASDLATIFGVYIENMDSVLESKIINNTITTTATVYPYALKLRNTTSDISVKNNTLEATGVKFASGFDAYQSSNVEVTYNKINVKAENITYGIVFQGELDYDTYMEVFMESYDMDEAFEAAVQSHDNLIKFNEVTAESEVSNLIQLYYTFYTDILYNNLTATVSHAVGIGGVDSYDEDIAYNNINIISDGKKTDIAGDSIPFYTAGIKLLTDGMHSGGENDIYQNNITITIPEEVKVPAINLTQTRNNEVHENYLISTIGLGDKAVYQNFDDGNDIHDNIPIESTITTDKESYTFQDGNDETVNITVNTTTTDKGTISVYVNNNETAIMTIPNVSAGNMTINTSQIYDYIEEPADSYEITLAYTNENEWLIPSNTTFTLNVIRKATSIDYFIVNDVEGKVVIEVTLFDEDGEEIDNAKISLTNDNISATVKSGKTFKDKTLTPGEYEILANFTGTKTYRSSETKINVTVKKDPNKIIEELNDVIEDLQDNITDLQDALDNATGKISELNGTVGNLTDALNNATGKIDELNGTVGNLTDALNNATGKISELNGTVGNLTDALNNATGKISELNGTVGNLTDALNNATGKINDLEGNVTDLNNALSQANDKINELNKTVDDLTKDLGTANDKINELNGTVNNLTDKLSQTNDKVDELNNTAKELAKDLSAANDKIDELNKTNGELSDALDAANDKIDELNKTNGELSDALDAANDKIDELNKTNGKLSDALDAANDKIDELTKQASDLAKKLDDANKQVKDLEKTVDEQEKIIKDLTTPTDVKLSADKIATIKYSDNVSITGTLVDVKGNPVKNNIIIVNIDGVQSEALTNSKGVYNATVQAKVMGTNNVTVTYEATDKYNAAKATTTFNVVKQNLKISIDKINSVKYKDNVTITGIFTDANDKPISNTLLNVNINGKTVKVKTDKNGLFIYSAVVSKVGTNNVTISYNGNKYYNKASQKATFNVIKQNLVLTIDRISTLKYKDSMEISGKLADGNGKAIGNTLITIKYNGKTYKAKTDKNGIYVLSTRASSVGTNNITVSYAGNANYNKATSTSNFKVEKQDIIIGFDSVTYSNGKVTVSGTFTDRNRHALMNSLARVTINGKTGTAKTNSEGSFTYTTSAKAGAIQLTLAYPGNKNYNSYSKTTRLTVA